MSVCRCHRQMSGELHPSQNLLSRSSEGYTLSLFFLSSWASWLHQRDAALSLIRFPLLFPPLMPSRSPSKSSFTTDWAYRQADGFFSLSRQMTPDLLPQVTWFWKHNRQEELEKGAGADVTGKGKLSAVTMPYPNNSVHSDSNLLKLFKSWNSLQTAYNEKRTQKMD